MNKTKKIATAVVSVVLASTMLVGITACGDDDIVSTVGGLEVSATIEEDGTVVYDYAEGTNLSMNVGYKASYGYISYQSAVMGEDATLFGTTYTNSSLKPAWQALSDELKVTFTDSYTELDSKPQITQAITDNKLASYNMITGESATIVTQAQASANTFLDLSLYLDYMPNFKRFLQDNPIVYMSLVSDTDDGSIYYAPYFDGNDDIEKYELVRQDWVEKLLDGTSGSSTETFASQASSKQKASIDGDNIHGDVGDGTTYSATSFMGKTGSWKIDSAVQENGSTKSIVTITVNYDNVITEAQKTDSDLNKALLAAGVTASDISGLTSGNIVDLQNIAIKNTNGAVTGAQLLGILRAYVDAAYLDSNGSSYYSTRSDVFNGSDAAWDVDLLVAMFRCVCTNVSVLGTKTSSENVYALASRENKASRWADLTSLAGELYGVRGLTSRYEYSYVDSTGKMQDARANADMYTALDNLNCLVEEGLIYSGEKQDAAKSTYYTASGEEVFMLYDYVQTQTANGGFAAQGVSPVEGVDSTYNFAPINTPVSKWNDGSTNTTATVNGNTITYDYDGSSKYMRFTESWRSVKNTGFAVPYASVSNDPDKLAACLATIDYMFSNDGQILMTYGPQSDNNDISGSGTSYTSNATGFWYDKEAEGVSLTDVAELVPGSTQYTIKDEYKSQYYVYKNKVYTDATYYNGEMTPTMTTANLYMFYGYEVNGLQLSAGTYSNAKYALSYTSYARFLIGSCLPLCNKMQSFEYQCTAECGIAGADTVGENLTNGTISHVSQDPSNSKGYWYVISPTALPYTTNQSSAINNDFNNLTSLTGQDSTYNLFTDIILHGLDGETSTGTYQPNGTSITLPSSAADAVTLVCSTSGNYKCDTLIAYMQSAWTDILGYYNDNIK